MVSLEKDVVKEIRSCLISWHFDGTVVYWERLNSGKVQSGPHWIRMCRIGTPDFIAVVRNKQDNLSVVFIECKSDTGKLRKEQQDFVDKYNVLKDVYVITVRCRKDLVDVLLKVGRD